MYELHYVYPFIHWRTLGFLPSFFFFHLLTTGNNAAVSISIQISIQVFAFIYFGYLPEVELLNYMVILYLIF